MRGFRCGAGSAGARRVVAALAAAALVAGLLAACSAGTSRPGHAAPAASPGVPVKGLGVARPKKIKAANEADRKFRATRTAWPPPAAATVALRGPSAGQAAGAPSGVRGTPVWVQAVASRRPRTDAAWRGPSVVSARVLSHARATALGLSALVFEVSAAGGAADGQVRVGLNYRSFAQAYGGNYGSRLRLVSLPACALTTPQVAACRKQSPLDSVQDYRGQAVSAVVRLGGSPTAELTSYSPGRGTALRATAATGMSIIMLPTTDADDIQAGIGPPVRWCMPAQL